MARNDKSFSAMGMVLDILAIPGNWMIGFLIGLAAPLAAIAAVVAGIRLLTGQMPFLDKAWQDEEGGRYLSLKLVPPEQVGELFAAQKEQIGGDITKIQAEIKAIIDEAKAKAETATTS